MVLVLYKLEVARLESAGRSSRFALRQRAEAFATDGRIDKF
jgi:hypothetical protein